MYTTFTLHRMVLTLSAREPGGVAPLGVLPTFTRKEDLTAQTKWMQGA